MVVLPVEHDLPVPDMPPGRVWSAAERGMWDDLWRSPQAAQWDESYAAVVGLYVALTVELLGGNAAAWKAAEARQLADRLGLTPAGMAANGWRFAEAHPPAPVTPLRGVR